MDDFTHQPELVITALAEVFQLPQEILIHTVGHVQTQTVDLKLVHPHGYSIEDVLFHVRMTQVQLHKVVVAFPPFVPERITPRTVAAEVEVLEPRTIWRRLQIFADIFKRPKAASHMIEHTVQNNSDAVVVQSCTDPGETFVIAKTVVYMVVIVGIVSVGSRHKHGTEIHGVDVHFFQVWDEVNDLIQTVRLLTVIDSRCSAEAQRIDVIEDRFVDPIHG